MVKANPLSRQKMRNSMLTGRKFKRPQKPYVGRTTQGESMHSSSPKPSTTSKDSLIMNTILNALIAASADDAATAAADRLRKLRAEQGGKMSNGHLLGTLKKNKPSPRNLKKLKLEGNELYFTPKNWENITKMYSNTKRKHARAKGMAKKQFTVNKCVTNEVLKSNNLRQKYSLLKRNVFDPYSPIIGNLEKRYKNSKQKNQQKQQQQHNSVMSSVAPGFVKSQLDRAGVKLTTPSERRKGIDKRS